LKNYVHGAVADSSLCLACVVCCYAFHRCPKKAKRGRPPPKEGVEAFLAAAESGLARRFATK
jgi:hypothetical protein